MKMILTPEFIEDLERLMPDENERQAFVNELQRQFASGEFFVKSQPVDMDKLAVDNPELRKSLTERHEAFEPPTLN